MPQSMKPLSIQQVQIQDEFWSSRQKQVQDVVVPYQWAALNDEIPDAEPSYSMSNLKIAAKVADGQYHGMIFQDSDLYKWLETVGYVLSQHHDDSHSRAQLESLADSVIDLLEKAQWPDGYLNTYFTLVRPEDRWKNLRDEHELYCAGHLIEAAVAYYEATGKRKILDIVCRLADHIGAVFGPGPDRKHGYPGHPELELALFKLYRTTANKDYLHLAKYFIDERGRQPNYYVQEAVSRGEIGASDRNLEYWQAHAPLLEQHKAVGHAVRAMYLYSGATDVATEYEDEEMLAHLRELWDNVTKRRLYVTGGIGSSAHDEAFTVDYDLPNDRAYTESCAAIGLMLWAHRMLQVTKDARYADVMERALYNGILSGISLDGTKYFYVNPLEVKPAIANHRHDMRHITTVRQPWFGCACCPPNIARLMSSLGQYLYSVDESEQALYVHLFVAGQAFATVDQNDVEITLETAQPWDGDVAITVNQTKDSPWTLALRIPAWCRGNFSVLINGKYWDYMEEERGYLKITRQWQAGDQLQVSFAMDVQIVRANPLLRADIGKVCLQRGPFVYCLEEADNGANLHTICLSNSGSIVSAFESGLLGGVAVITASGCRLNTVSDDLYSTDLGQKMDVTLRAIPYYAWANRGEGEMTVWVNEA